MSLSSMINNSHLIKRIPATHHIIYRIILKMIDIVTYEMRFNNIVPIYKQTKSKAQGNASIISNAKFLAEDTPPFSL